MQYEEIESYIRTNRPDIWRKLYPLHGFYRNEITRITAENCVFLACYEEAKHGSKHSQMSWFQAFTSIQDRRVSPLFVISLIHNKYDTI